MEFGGRHGEIISGIFATLKCPNIPEIIFRSKADKGKLTMNDELIDLNVRYLKEPEPVLPEGTTAKQALEMVYRGLIELTPQQMRAAIELLPYENPKLSATAIATMDGATFAEALERCIERSRSPVPRLNGPVEPLPPEELKRPMSRYRRF